MASLSEECRPSAMGCMCCGREDDDTFAGVEFAFLADLEGVLAEERVVHLDCNHKAFSDHTRKGVIGEVPVDGDVGRCGHETYWRMRSYGGRSVDIKREPHPG